MSYSDTSCIKNINLVEIIDVKAPHTFIMEEEVEPNNNKNLAQLIKARQGGRVVKALDC